MSARIVFAMPGNEAMACEIAKTCTAEIGVMRTRRFPDGESYVRIASNVVGKRCVIVCTLARPDEQIMALILAAGALREWGASRVELIAPYLPYLRQDRHFRLGEALSARHFARLLSAHFDRLATVNPHLHRIESLSEIYSIPTDVVSAGPLLGAWIGANLDNSFLVGPDSESTQWVASAAAAAHADYCVLAKARSGDTVVDLSWPDLNVYSGRTPVLLDDIASSGRTLIEAATGLSARGFAKPVCVVVHALLGERAFAELRDACARVVSTNSVPHASNLISVAPLLAAL